MATQPSIFDDVPAWPESPAPAPMGHNLPPLEERIPAEFKEALLSEKPQFLTRLEQLIEAADRAKATNDDELGRCGNLVKGYREAIAHIDATHKAVKEPYLAGGRLVDAEKSALRTRVEAAKAKVEALGDAYVAKKDAKAKAERARIEAEQRAAAEAAARADRERQEAEAAAERAKAAAVSDDDRAKAEAEAEAAAQRAEEAMQAAALAPSVPDRPEPIRSDEGATVSGKQEWKSEVTDYTLAFMAVEDHPKVREAIDKAIAQQVKAGKRQIEGVRIWPVAKANFR